MKLDKDLIRTILLAVESSNEDPRGWITLNLPEYFANEVSYHVQLLDEAGFLEAQDLCHLGADGYEWRPKRMTYEGHEFLDTIRDPEIWHRTKEGAKKAGIASVQLLWELGKAYARQKATERLGFNLG
jgi:Hypothetical protein (DUF2513)